MAPAWYVIGATIVGQIALLLMPESAPAKWKGIPDAIGLARTPA